MMVRDRIGSVGTPGFINLEPVKDATLSCEMKLNLGNYPACVCDVNEFVRSKLSFTAIEEKPPQEENLCERDKILGATD